MQKDVIEKERKLKGVIDQLTRKSNLNQNQLLVIKQEIDKERRKSMADEQQIRKLEKILDQNAAKTQEQIKELQDEL